ncbi:ABC transporter ATP-binding protein [Paenibacillus thiaminolyticus]|uniref:ABC transporter ATP-binding protein n=1 Tax=Paenibacillus thiaminolyticus TaxID=49283 RepID=UPI003D2C4403
MSDSVIEVKNISKRFKIYDKPWKRLVEWATFGSLKKHEQFWALKNINFKLNKGEVLGIVGPNGAGKSTLLKILTGALSPTTGEIILKGNVVSLLELGTGFHPELTGMQNIYNSTSLLGFEPEYIKQKLDKILEFAEIEDFINMPVKTYSSGMYVRLAFSLFANLDPDIYIVDEALAVGDVFFQQKCYQKLMELREKGVTIIIVSHDPAPLINFCDYAMLIDGGTIVDTGDPAGIWELLQARRYAKSSKTKNFNIKKEDNRIVYGDGSVKIIKVECLNEQQQPCNIFKVGDVLKMKVQLEVLEDIKDITVGIQLKNRLGNVLFGTNSNWSNRKIVVNGDKLNVEITFPVNLGCGEYTVSLAAAEDKRFSEKIYVWDESALNFEVVEDDDFTFGGDIYLPIEFSQERS